MKARLEGPCPVAQRRPGLAGGAPAARLDVLDRVAIRLFDIVVALGLVVLLSPLFVLVALAVVLDSRGPILYRASRAGLGGRSIAVLKFRKMTADAVGSALTLCEDDRFTRVGRFLARTKLDELPQLLNVLAGQMSLVGPRPEDPRFVALYDSAYHDEILTVRPGITGLSQLAFAKEGEVLNPEDRVGDYVARILPQKVALDCLYAKRRSIVVNVRVLFWTVVTVGLRRGVSVNRATGALRLRRRPAAVVAYQRHAVEAQLPAAQEAAR